MPAPFSYDAHGQLRWGSEAAGLLIVECCRRRVLLVRRSENVMDPGVWAVPGGRVEPEHRDALSTAKTEAEEELGSLPRIRPRYADVYRSGDFTYTTYVCTISDRVAADWRIRLNWENDAYGWFAMDDLPEPLHDNVRRVVAELASR